MGQLISVATNILYKKVKVEEKDVYKKHFELVFLVDEPDFKYSNEGSLIRERKIARQSFNLSEKHFEALIDQLKKLKDAEEEDLA